jgi:hypothetical protein
MRTFVSVAMHELADLTTWIKKGIPTPNFPSLFYQAREDDVA